MRQTKPDRLTEAAVAALAVTGRDTIIFDAGSDGFGVRVTPAGTKIFIAQARVAGRPRRVAIGRFPDLTVAGARKAARAALQDMRAGRDPKLEHAARAVALVAGQTTVADFADRWLAEHDAQVIAEALQAAKAENTRRKGAGW